MKLAERIEANPGVMLGKPVIRGTRVPVELILRRISEGASEEALMASFPSSDAGRPSRRCCLCGRHDRERQDRRDCCPFALTDGLPPCAFSSIMSSDLPGAG
jgi:hypothetical protein